MKKTIPLIIFIIIISLCSCGKSSVSNIDNIKTKNISFHEISFAIPESYEELEDELFETDEKYDSMFFVDSNNDTNFICIARRSDNTLTNTLPEAGEERNINGIKGKLETEHSSNIFKSLSIYTFNIETEDGIVRYEISGDDETKFEVVLQNLRIK